MKVNAIYFRFSARRERCFLILVCCFFCHPDAATAQSHKTVGADPCCSSMYSGEVSADEIEQVAGTWDYIGPGPLDFDKIRLLKEGEQWFIDIPSWNEKTELTWFGDSVADHHLKHAVALNNSWIGVQYYTLRRSNEEIVFDTYGTFKKEYASGRSNHFHSYRLKKRLKKYVSVHHSIYSGRAGPFGTTYDLEKILQLQEKIRQLLQTQPVQLRKCFGNNLMVSGDLDPAEHVSARGDHIEIVTRDRQLCFRDTVDLYPFLYRLLPPEQLERKSPP